jgi:hypothetical protein
LFTILYNRTFFEPVQEKRQYVVGALDGAWDGDLDGAWDGDLEGRVGVREGDFEGLRGDLDGARDGLRGDFDGARDGLRGDFDGAWDGDLDGCDVAGEFVGVDTVGDVVDGDKVVVLLLLLMLLFVVGAKVLLLLLLVLLLLLLFVLLLLTIPDNPTPRPTDNAEMVITTIIIMVVKVNGIPNIDFVNVVVGCWVVALFVNIFFFCLWLWST